MASATLGSVSLAGNPGSSWSSGTKYIEKARVGARIYRRGHPDAAGDDGTGQKNFGFRKQPLTFTCRYIAGTGDAAIAAAAADLATLSTGTFSVTYGGVSFGTGELNAEQSHLSEEHGLGISGNFFVDLVLSIDIIRLPS